MNDKPVERRSNKVPVSVIAGFLGSGKTTLLNRLIQHPGMSDAALIVNEFGEIGIDHALVDSALENTVVMDSGCLCCTIRGDLIDTISELFAPQFIADGPLDEEIQAEMARHLEADSLRYLPVESVARAIGLDADQLCRACITGQYPTPCGQELAEMAMANHIGGVEGRTYETVGSKQ